MPENTPRPDIAQARRTLRNDAIARRNALDAGHVAACSDAICLRLAAQWPMPPGRVVGFCWPMQQEPDVRTVVRHWIGLGATAVLPVVDAADRPLRFRPWIPDAGGGAMVPDRFGIPTPVAGPELDPDVLLIPVNAFDAALYRIGYGGGYFDRTIAGLATRGRRPLVIGVGFEIAAVASTFPQAHDEPLDWLVTEQRLLGH